MSDTKAYLHLHGDYQLEQVGVKQLVTLLCFSVSALVTSVVTRGGEATGHLILFKFIFLVAWGGCIGTNVLSCLFRWMVQATVCSWPSRRAWQSGQPKTLTIPIFQIGISEGWW